jgi:hypothetical protein
MSSRRIRWIAWTAVSCSIFLSSSGCSMFRSKRTLDMAPFAENTSMMFAEARKVARPFRPVNLRPYAGLPELAELRDQSLPVLVALRGLVLYSNQIVALNMSSKSDTEKNALLADYLQRARETAVSREKLANIGVSVGALDSCAVAIRGAETFLQGIRAASLLVNTVVLALLDRIDGLQDQLAMAMSAIDAAIQERYRGQRQAYEGLTRLHTRYLIAATWLYESKSETPGAVDSLLAVEPSLGVFLPEPHRVDRQQLQAAEEELVQRLDHVDAMLEQLNEEKAAYVAETQELQDLRMNLDQRLKIARDSVVLWGQSHRNLGEGVATPPLINVAGMASGAVKTVVP